MKRYGIWFATLLMLLAVCAGGVNAGQSGGASGNDHLGLLGVGAAIENGEFVSHNAGGALDTYYSWFVEVPAGLPQLVVDVFDADNGGANDFQVGGSWDTDTDYTLLDPSGTPVATITGNAAGPGAVDDATFLVGHGLLLLAALPHPDLVLAVGVVITPAGRRLGHYRSVRRL